MKLNDLMVSSVAAWVDYPGFPGLQFEINILSRDEITKIQKDCTTVSYDPLSRRSNEIMDEAKFLEAYGKRVVTNWKGLTYYYLQDFVVIDTTKIPDLKEEFPYDPDSVGTLLKNSTTFDNWVSAIQESRSTFRRDGAGKVVEATKASAGIKGQ